MEDLVDLEGHDLAWPLERDLAEPAIYGSAVRQIAFLPMIMVCEGAHSFEWRWDEGIGTQILDLTRM